MNRVKIGVDAHVERYAAQYIASGHVMLEPYDSAYGQRATFVKADEHCMQPVRGDTLPCLLPPKHGGSHSAHVVCCELCSRYVRESSTKQYSDGFDGSVRICFFCERRRA